jgi:hypothetical protein
MCLRYNVVTYWYECMQWFIFRVYCFLEDNCYRSEKAAKLGDNFEIGRMRVYSPSIRSQRAKHFKGTFTRD